MRYFFFYGTLIAGSRNPVEAAVHRKLVAMGPATARGRLYAIRDPLGWYPALLPGCAAVRGFVYRLAPDFGPADLALLDEYEGFDIRCPARSLYMRKRICIASDEPELAEAETYRFNAPLPPGARRVRGGDFHAWLALHRLSAYSGL